MLALSVMIVYGSHKVLGGPGEFHVCGVCCVRVSYMCVATPLKSSICDSPRDFHHDDVKGNFVDPWLRRLLADALL